MSQNPTSNPNQPEPSDANWALTHIDLLSERYGGQALSCNDEFFAEASNLVKRAAPIFLPDEYTDRGKWMDGWESRRRRTAGHDWCILRLGLPGKVHAFDVDTTFFRGNAPAEVAIEYCHSAGEPDANSDWQPLLHRQAVLPHSHNWFTLQDSPVITHLRLNIFPDGGVARLRAWGEAQPDWSQCLPGELVDLAASTHGGRAIACSDMFFSPMNNLIAPGHGVNMGDGWETRRRRGPGHDWLIVQLASPGQIRRVLLDTRHFKGNYPDRFMLEAAALSASQAAQLACANANPDTAATALMETIEWTPLIAETKLCAHREHWFQDEVQAIDASFTHVRLNIYPDGGVSRLRLFGYPAHTRTEDASA